MEESFQVSSNNGTDYVIVEANMLDNDVVQKSVVCTMIHLIIE